MSEPFFSSLKHQKYAILKLFVCGGNSELIQLYREKANAHNLANIDNEHYNSGFDLFVPNVCSIDTDKTTFVSMQVKSAMANEKGEVLSYYMYPRSSISKTPLILANHVGIIDSGYRGELTGAFRCLDKSPYVIEQYTRLLQVCAPDLCPLYVVICENESELGNTARGEGGFGSTGTKK